MKTRRKLSIALTSLVLALACAVALIWYYPPAHSIEAIVQVTNEPVPSLFEELEPRSPDLEIERFANTQIALIKSKFVLISALNRPDVAQLEAVKAKEPDPVEWLAESLQVNFYDSSDVLEIRYEGLEDTEEMKKLLEAIIRTYQSEVVGQRIIAYEEYRANLDKMVSDLTDELHDKLEMYYSLLEELTIQPSAEHQNAAVAGLETFSADNMQELLSLAQERVVHLDRTPAQSNRILKTSLETIGQRVVVTLPDAQLTILSEEIEQLTELTREAKNHLRKLEIEHRTKREPFRFLQKPMATEYKRSVGESYGLACAGGLGTVFASYLSLSVLVPLYSKFANA